MRAMKYLRFGLLFMGWVWMLSSTIVLAVTLVMAWMNGDSVLVRVNEIGEANLEKVLLFLGLIGASLWIEPMMRTFIIMLEALRES